MAVVARHVPHGRTTWASIFGSTFAHRLFDLPPTVGLVIYVLMASRIPRWAESGVEIVLAVGGALLLLGLVLAWWGRRNGGTSAWTGSGPGAGGLWHMPLRGLRVFHSPGPAFAAAFFQLLGWVAQLFAVYFAFKAFQIVSPSRPRPSFSSSRTSRSRSRSGRVASGCSRLPSRPRSSPTASPTGTGLPTGSACRRSRRRWGSASASSSSPARASRSRC